MKRMENRRRPLTIEQSFDEGPMRGLECVVDLGPRGLQLCLTERLDPPRDNPVAEFREARTIVGRERQRPRADDRLEELIEIARGDGAPGSIRSASAIRARLSPIPRGFRSARR